MEAPRARPSASRRWLAALQRTAELTREDDFTLADLLDRQGERRGDSPALLAADGPGYGYAALAQQCRGYTRWALAQGLGRGTCVALLARNAPDYLAFWAGVTRTGAVVALVNNQLRGAGLAQALEASAAGLVVADDACMAAAEETVQDALPLHRLSSLIRGGAAALPTGAHERRARQADTALLLFTSGTTGLPKAARISHERLLSWCGWFAGLTGAREDDRLYDCLPMYHSVGGITALGAMLVAGGSAVVRDGFSAQAFWGDIARHDCTLVQYIGELWRYLLARPLHAAERAHRLRMACGAGLGEAVWSQAQARFALPSILEFYAATEGVFSLYNLEERPGSLGRHPPFLAHSPAAVIVQVDPDTSALLRGDDGLCLPCGLDQAGEALGRVADRTAGPSAFEGYTDPLASSAKLVRDVLRTGDTWLRTGDRMRRDASGFFYFVERCGETFRWKGENASTHQVGEVLERAPGVRAAAVYGVAVPGADGRAGMAALVAGPEFRPDALQPHLDRHLPPQAQPVFLRLLDELPVTATLKVRVAALQADGFDLTRVGRVYWRDPAAGGYRELDAAVAARIAAGTVRL